MGMKMVKGMKVTVVTIVQSGDNTKVTARGRRRGRKALWGRPNGDEADGWLEAGSDLALAVLTLLELRGDAGTGFRSITETDRHAGPPGTVSRLLARAPG